MMRRWMLALLTSSTLLLGGCGYNDIQSKDEAIKSGWSEVLNQYHRRADLTQNLVNTVKGYASHEEEVLTTVTEPRSRGGQTRTSAAATTRASATWPKPTVRPALACSPYDRCASTMAVAWSSPRSPPPTSPPSRRKHA